MDLESLSELYHQEEASARAAGLHYTLDDEPGFTRRKHGQGFVYVDASGENITKEKTKEWIESLVIPPAWTEVWISSDPKNHLLVTGRDELGRKQYMYHPKWREFRDLLNFYQLILFGHALPDLRKKLRRDRHRDEVDKTKAIAVLLTLLDKTYIRIGNAEYAKKYESYGLTTLLDKHVKCHDDHVVFAFRGKSGQDHEIQVDDPELCELIKECRDVPGRILFSYFTEDGTSALTPQDVNDYLREATQHEFTAKLFRTWGGTLTTYRSLRDQLTSKEDKQPKKMLIQALDETAETLGNTRAVSKSSYVHPHLLEAFENNRLPELLKKLPKKKSVPFFSQAEQEMVKLLQILLKEKIDVFGK